MTYHIPALLEPTLQSLDIKPNGVYVDCTLGGAGHSGGILAHLGAEGRLYSIDRDIEAIERARRMIDDPRFVAIHGDFRYLENYMDYYGVAGNVDGILADLGVSFHHFDESSRGFSFRSDGPLDMRMNTLGGPTAADLIAGADEEQLSSWLRLYGELQQSHRIASALVRARAASPITTTGALVSAVDQLLNPARRKQELAQIFQAFRIVVNGEIRALEALLDQSLSVLAPGGRLCVITYHSLEDRLVKNFMRAGRTDGKIEKDIYGRADTGIRPLGKPVTPGTDEIEANPRSRSARLRTAEKK